MSSQRFAAVAAIAERQHGAISRRQLSCLGVPPATLARWVTRGLLRRADNEAFTIAGSAPTRRQELMVAVLTHGSHAVVSHRCAAELWKIAGGPAPIELTAPRWLRRRRDVVVHESTRLPDVHTTRFDGVPVTTPARTLVDLCRLLRPPAASQAFDEAFRRKLATPEEVDEVIGQVARRGRPGIRLARRLTQVRLGGHLPGASALEDLVHDLLVAAGLGRPVRNHVVHDGEGPLEIDLAYPDARVGIETDGRVAHLNEHAFVWDRDKQTRLQALGWVIVRVPWDTYRHRPGFLIAKVAQVLDGRRRAAA
jgi:hypothetical protein